MLAFVGRMSLLKRGEPVCRALFWVVRGKLEPEAHSKVLPDYCYKIFEKLRVTLFKAYPSFEKTVSCTDQAGLAQVMCYEEVKQFVWVDWYQFGKVVSLPVRAARLFELELDKVLEKEGLLNLSVEDEKFVEQFLGVRSLKDGLEGFRQLEADKIGGNSVLQLVRCGIEAALGQESMWSKVAYQWGPEAMPEFKRGVADGLKEFMDGDGQLVGQTTRTWNYIFFLLAWPEIQEMLERPARPNRTEVFGWLRPYQDAGLTSIPTVENFHDFCEDIGLKFAGRPAKKAK